MSRELIYIRCIQVIISINTLIFTYSIIQARKGNIGLHRRLNTFALTTTFFGIAGLLGTLVLGWNYQSLTTPERLLFHRYLSCPLAVVLPFTAYFGWKGKRRPHLVCVSIAIPLWIGVLITGLIFF